MTTLTTKPCLLCSTHKQLSAYRRETRNVDSYSDICRECYYSQSHPGDPAFKLPIDQVCTGCGANKLITDYHRDSYTKTGYRTKCKACVKARNQATPEQREILRLRSNEWGQLYNTPDRPKIKTQYTRGLKRRSIVKRRTQINKNPLPTNYMHTLIFFYGTVCMNPNCSYPASDFNVISHDHVVPLSKGGLHSFDNSQLLCRLCNSAKSAHSSIDYRPFVVTDDLIEITNAVKSAQYFLEILSI